MQFFRVRETSMKMAEIRTGARKTYGLKDVYKRQTDITPRITWAGFGFAFLAFVSLLAA